MIVNTTGEKVIKYIDRTRFEYRPINASDNTESTITIMVEVEE